MIKERSFDNYIWVNLVTPSPEEVSQVVKRHHLPLKFKNYLLDRHEQPRADADLMTDFAILVLRAVSGANNQQQRTTPMCLAFNEHVLVTVSHVRNHQWMFAHMPVNPDGDVSEPILRIINRLVRPYFSALDDIIARTDRLSNQQLHYRITNKRLDQLSLFRTRLIYLWAATGSNLVAMQELQGILQQRFGNRTKRSQVINQELADTLVEFKQCQTMFDVVSDELSETAESFGNLLDNRLNDTMVFLTVWSLVLAIPPIVSGFYGMNMYLPLASRNLAWVDSLFITAALILLMVILYLIHTHRKR